MSAPDNLSVLQVAAPGPIGGLERVLHDLAIGLHQRGHNIHVAALVSEGVDYSPVLDPLREAGVPLHLVPVGFHSVLRERAQLRTICREHRIRIVHTHGYRADIVHSGAARRMGLATASTEHGMSKMGGRTRIYEWVQMRLFRRCDAVIAVSQPIAQALERAGVDPKRVHLIPNAWTGFSDFLPRPEARAALDLPAVATVIGWVGRLIHAKGADVFLRAVASLRDLNVCAALIGDGPERRSLEALRDELRLADSVRFYGAIPDARRYYRAFDVFALTSRSEGTPIVLFEAMAAQVPILATTVGGVPMVVSDRIGLVVPPNDPTAVANALSLILRDPRSAQIRADHANMQLTGEHDLGLFLDRYQGAYQSIDLPPVRQV